MGVGGEGYEASMRMEMIDWEAKVASPSYGWNPVCRLVGVKSVTSFDASPSLISLQSSFIFLEPSSVFMTGRVILLIYASSRNTVCNYKCNILRFHDFSSLFA